MHICKKCGKPIYNEDRGNIGISLHVGYEHLDCSIAYAKVLEVEQKVSVLEKIEEKLENSVKTFKPSKEKEDTVDEEIF